LVLGRRDDPSTDPDRKDAGLPPLLAVEGHGQSLLRLDVHLGNGPLALLPGAEDQKAELKALDERIERFRAQIQTSPERREQLEAKIREIEGRKQAVAAKPAAPKPGSAWAQATFVPLTDDAGSDAKAQKLVDAYDESVSRINLEEAKKQPESCPAAAPSEPAYVGAARCARCHEDATVFWTQTRHARAYQTLVQVNKQFSLDCVRCHVTGWQQPGGVCRIDRTAAGAPGFLGHGKGRQDVQCETCHGPGSEHANDPTGHIAAKVPVSVCVRCHEAANSPHFDDVRYRPYVIGPGHGDPLARGEEPHPRASGSGPNAELKASAKTAP
jgi:hypothetical protein